MSKIQEKETGRENSENERGRLSFLGVRKFFSFSFSSFFVTLLVSVSSFQFHKFPKMKKCLALLISLAIISLVFATSPFPGVRSKDELHKFVEERAAMVLPSLKKGLFPGVESSSSSSPSLSQRASKVDGCLNATDLTKCNGCSVLGYWNSVATTTDFGDMDQYFSKAIGKVVLRFKKSHMLKVEDRVDIYGTQQFIDEYNEIVENIDDCHGSKLKASKPLVTVTRSSKGEWSQSAECSLQTCDIDESSCVVDVKSQKICGENLQKSLPGESLDCTTDNPFFALDNRIFFSEGCQELNLNRLNSYSYSSFEKGSSASSLGISFLSLSVIILAHLGL